MAVSVLCGSFDYLLFKINILLRINYLIETKLHFENLKYFFNSVNVISGNRSVVYYLFLRFHEKSGYANSGMIFIVIFSAQEKQLKGAEITRPVFLYNKTHKFSLLQKCQHHSCVNLVKKASQDKFSLFCWTASWKRYFSYCQQLFKVIFFSVIPQSCRFRGVKYECGLSISCVLGGGRPLDLCSGGMIWACCVDRDVQTPTHHPDVGVLNNASKFRPMRLWM